MKNVGFFSGLISAIMLLMVVTASAHSLDPQKKMSQYIVDIWTADNGLPQNSVQSIYQSKSGFIWVGTQEGLLKFDGIQFDIYDQKRDERIKNNYVTAISEDSKGNIYTGTSGGGFYVLSKGNITTYMTADGLSNDFVTSIKVDNRDRVWIGTNNGLNLLENGKLRKFYTNNGLTSNNISSILIDRQNNVWVSTDAGLNKYTGGSFYQYTTANGLTSNVITSLSLDNSDKIWVSTNEGISVFDGYSFSKLSASNGLPENLITYVYQDRVGTYWIGTTGGGLIRYANGIFSKMTMENGLSNNTIFTIMEDEEGSLWMGTNGGGLCRLKDAKFNNLTEKEGLASKFSWCIYQDSKGGMWYGSNDNGVSNVVNGISKIYNEKNGLPNNTVRTVTEDKSGNIWVGTNGGAAKISNGKIAIYSTKNGLTNDGIRAVKCDKSGNVWIATNGNGVNVISPEGKIQVYTTSNGLSNDFPKCFFEDSRGDFWVGTNKGLNKFNGNSFQRIDLSQGDTKHNAANIIRCIYEDMQGTYWFGSNGGGLIRYKNGKVFYFSGKNGLYDESVFSILEDSNGLFWMSCNKGIFSVSKSQLDNIAEKGDGYVTSTPYGKADGMKSNECNGGQPGGFKSRDGKLYFPTIEGVVEIDPLHLVKNDIKPKVFVEKVIIDDKSIVECYGDKVEFPAGTQKIEIHYTGLSFIMPSKVKFKYMLEGIDDDWVDGGNRRFAIYTNLSPGNYKFKVIACNNDGLWSEPIESEFYLRPYFYQMWWFRIIVIIALGYGGYRVYLWRMKIIKKREEDLKDQLRMINESKLKVEESEIQLKEQIRISEEAKQIVEKEKKYLNDNVDKILSIINKFSSGDLTAKMIHDVEDEIGKLCFGFNGAIDNISNMLSFVKNSIQNTVVLTANISSTTEEMAVGMSELKYQINESSLAIEEMTNTIQDTTKNVISAAETAKEAGKIAHSSSSNVFQLIEGMNKISDVVISSSGIIKELGTSSQKIGDIVEVINDIADQTNLLALNAAIEAARAGEQGRGFAVVADEVRKLAEKTSKATGEIHNMIKEIQHEVTAAVSTILNGEKEVETGKQIAEIAGESIKEIYNASEKVTLLIEQIAAASEQQASTSSEIMSSVSQINNVAEETSSAINNIANSTVDLSKKAETMQELISKFKVSENE